MWKLANKNKISSHYFLYLNVVVDKFISNNCFFFKFPFKLCTQVRAKAQSGVLDDVEWPPDRLSPVIQLWTGWSVSTYVTWRRLLRRKVSDSKDFLRVTSSFWPVVSCSSLQQRAGHRMREEMFAQFVSNIHLSPALADIFSTNPFVTMFQATSPTSDPGIRENVSKTVSWPHFQFTWH